MVSEFLQKESHMILTLKLCTILVRKVATPKRIYPLFLVVNLQTLATSINQARNKHPVDLCPLRHQFLHHLERNGVPTVKIKVHLVFLVHGSSFPLGASLGGRQLSILFPNRKEALQLFSTAFSGGPHRDVIVFCGLKGVLDGGIGETLINQRLLKHLEVGEVTLTWGCALGVNIEQLHFI